MQTTATGGITIRHSVCRYLDAHLHLSFSPSCRVRFGHAKIRCNQCIGRIETDFAHAPLHSHYLLDVDNFLQIIIQFNANQIEGERTRYHDITLPLESDTMRDVWARHRNPSNRIP